MQAVRRLVVLRQSTLTHRRNETICAYHTHLQKQMKWLPSIHHTCQRHYSKQPRHHRFAMSSGTHQLLNKNLNSIGGCLAVGHPLAGHQSVRTKVNFEIISSDPNLSNHYIPSPAEFAYEYLEHWNESYPWWLTITMVAVAFRTCLVMPFTLHQQIVLSRLENAQVEINTEAEQLKQKTIATAKLQKWSQQKAEDYYGQELRYIIRDVHYKNRCMPSRLMWTVYVQMATWSTFTVAIGQMTGKFPQLFMAEPDIDFLPELCTQGVLWFPDLTEPSIALAVAYGIVNFALTELWSIRRGPLQKTQDVGHYAFKGISVGMAVVAAFMPSAVTLYWLSSSVAGLASFAFVRIPAIRRFWDVEETPSEMKNPWKDTKTLLKAKYTGKTRKYVA